MSVDPISPQPRNGGKTPAQVALNWLLCKGTIPIPGAKNAKQARKGTNGVSTNGVAANLMFFDRDLLGTPVNLLSSQKCQGAPFSPISQSLKKYYFCSGPISVNSICPQPKATQNAGALGWRMSDDDVELRGNHLSNTICLTQVFFKKWRTMWQIMLILDTTKDACNNCQASIQRWTSSAAQGAAGPPGLPRRDQHLAARMSGTGKSA